MTAPERPHLMVLVHNLMGTGHQRRAAAIARAAAARGWRATLVSGGVPLDAFDPGPLQLVQLPPARVPDLAFDRLVDEHGREVDDGWRARRRDALLACVHTSPPDVLLLETYPFGRKLLAFELEPLLEQLHAGGARRPLIASSIRDIVEYRSKPARYQQMADTARRWFDLVLVHADPRLVPLSASFPPFEDIADRVRYSGYVREHESGAAPAAGDDGRDEVIVSAGGGGYGQALLETALAAREHTVLAGHRWRILVGGHAPSGLLPRLRGAAPPGVLVEPARADFPALLGRAALSVSLGGYNTVLDVLERHVRAVVVAYHDATEREQLLRARVLAARGWVELLAHGELSVRALAASVDRAVQRVPPATGVAMDGARRSIDILAAALRVRHA